MKSLALEFIEIRKLTDAGEQSSALNKLKALQSRLASDRDRAIASGLSKRALNRSAEGTKDKTTIQRQGKEHERFFIVIPVKNGEVAIERTLKSIFRLKAVAPITIHVQDGLSSDGTVKVVKGLTKTAAQKGISLTIASEQDRSMYEAIVKGVERLNPPNTSWLTWINAGDILEENAIDCILRTQEVNDWHNINWICGCKSIENMEGRLVRFELPINSKFLSAGICDGNHFHYHQQEGTFFRAELFRSVPSAEFASFRLAGDYFLWWKLAKTGKTLYVHDEAFGTFVQSPDQLSRREQATYNKEIEKNLSEDERKRAFQRFIDRPTEVVSVKSSGHVRRYLVTIAKKMHTRFFSVADFERAVSERSIDCAIENGSVWLDPYYLQGDTTYKVPSKAPAKKHPFGIILFTHTRHDALRLVLRSLKEQNATNVTTVWIDGAQGKEKTRLETEESERIAHEYGVSAVKRIKGNYGFRKTMLHGLAYMTQKYDSFLILEDDCFPTRKAVETFRSMLNSIANDERVFSIYGHHFQVPEEGEQFPRFQGWGWGTTSKKLTPYLHRLVDLYSLLEDDYLKVVKRIATPEVLARIEITPPRQPSHTFFKFFAWDETLALLTGADGLLHAKTPEQTIHNFGMGKTSTHFGDFDLFRNPPFNLITIDEAWNKF
ncbi:glycosyl transferase family 2 [Thiorhodococcus drewsii AZ1]|uniref:Glycosyl transferase family 2 n=1 Tax=Thiorhodococcus drewsii AZ1 TaxID=765913 RepID=G2E5X4_9GAMM|nr:glycosyltransferase [Thiorhodococcus drewsii]EGV28537.1 glycosyl transferase family 2 [Thiorhodococcus drewsii AZ1]